MGEKRSSGLGRGLNDLFGVTSGVENDEKTGSIDNIPISQIHPNRSQPRRRFDEEQLAELAESITQNGLISPIALRKTGDNEYQIIAGERRWRASRIAGLDAIPAVVLKADDEQAVKLALVENLQREDLDPLEEADGYHMLMTKYGLTQEETAKSVGISRPAVANAIRLLSLPEDIKDMLKNGELSSGHARALLALDNSALQIEAAEHAAEAGLNVRQTEQLVKRLKTLSHEDKKDDAPTELCPAAYAAELSTKLSGGLGRRVRIVSGKKKGKIELEYYDNTDLDELVELLMRINGAQPKNGE